MPMREWLRSLPAEAIGGPIRQLKMRVRVRAWVVHPQNGWILIDGEATVYTAKAGRVEYVDEHGRVGSVWTWATAIVRLGANAPWSRIGVRDVQSVRTRMEPSTVVHH